MTAIKSLIKVKSQDALNENQDQIVIRNGNAKCQQEVAMSYSEVVSQLEQEYYNKSFGCTVKAQKDNLFDYKPQRKINKSHFDITDNDVFIVKAEKNLNSAILKITMKIREQFPELSKYIMEMPITVPNMENPKMNFKILQDYYNSLDEILTNYTANQNVTTK